MDLKDRLFTAPQNMLSRMRRKRAPSREIDSTLFVLGSLSYEPPRYLKAARKLGFTKLVFIDTHERFAERTDTVHASVRKLSVKDVRDAEEVDRVIVAADLRPKPGDIFLPGLDEAVDTVYQLSEKYKTAPRTLNPRLRALGKLEQGEVLHGKVRLPEPKLHVNSENPASIREAERAIEAAEKSGRSMMMKTPKESGGDGVMRVENVQQFRDYLPIITVYNSEFILEPYIDHNHADEFAIQGVAQKIATLQMNDGDPTNKILLDALAKHKASLPRRKGGMYRMVKPPPRDDAGKGESAAGKEKSQEGGPDYWNIISCDKRNNVLGLLMGVPFNSAENAAAEALQNVEYHYYVVALKNITRTHSDFVAVRQGDESLFERLSSVQDIKDEPAVLVKPNERGYMVFLGKTVLPPDPDLPPSDRESQKLFDLFPGIRLSSITCMRDPANNDQAIVIPNSAKRDNGTTPTQQATMTLSISPEEQAKEPTARVLAEQAASQEQRVFHIKKEDHRAFTACADMFREFTESGHIGQDPYLPKFGKLLEISDTALSGILHDNLGYQIDAMLTWAPDSKEYFLEASPRLPASFVLGDEMSPHYPRIEIAELQIARGIPLVWPVNQKARPHRAVGYLLANEKEGDIVEDGIDILDEGRILMNGLTGMVITKSTLKDHPLDSNKVILYGDENSVHQSLLYITGNRKTNLKEPKTPLASRSQVFLPEDSKRDKSPAKKDLLPHLRSQNERGIPPQRGIIRKVLDATLPIFFRLDNKARHRTQSRAAAEPQNLWDEDAPVESTVKRGESVGGRGSSLHSPNVRETHTMKSSLSDLPIEAKQKSGIPPNTSNVLSALESGRSGGDDTLPLSSSALSTSRHSGHLNR